MYHFFIIKTILYISVGKFVVTNINSQNSQTQIQNFIVFTNVVSKYMLTSKLVYSQSLLQAYVYFLKF